MLRLFRSALGKTYRKENTRFRDAARQLADLRDAAVMIETLGELLGRYEAGRGHLLHSVLDDKTLLEI